MPPADEKRYWVTAPTVATWIVAAFVIGMVVGTSVAFGGMLAGMSVAHHQEGR